MKTVVAMLILLTTVVSCSKQKAPRETMFEKLEFKVDSSKLGEVVETGGVRFHAPKEWLLVDSETISQIAGVAKRDTTEMQLMPLYAFKREGGGPMLLVSTFPRAVHLGAGFIPWAGEVARVYKSQRTDAVVQEHWIHVGGIEALQLYSQSGTLVHVKIILHASEPVSLDYTVPVELWPEEVRAIESSLASLRKMYP